MPFAFAPAELPKKIESMEMTAAFRQHVQQARQRHVAAWQRFLARSLDLLCFSLLALWLASLVGWLEPGEVTIPRFPVLMAVPLLSPSWVAW